MQRACRASTLCCQISALARFRGRPEHGLTQSLASQGAIGARDMARSANCRIKHMSSAPMSSKAGQGFSFPGPRQLKDIVKLPLLNAHGASRVREIWTEFHKGHKSAVADILTADEFGTLMQRSQRCPFFVLPVPRDGGYFTVLIQFQGKHCLMTYLEDYKANPAAAMPYSTFTLFDELVEKKGLVLIRGDVTNNLSRQEAMRLLALLKQFYIGPRVLFDSVVAFNEKSVNFRFDDVLRTAGVRS